MYVTLQAESLNTAVLAMLHRTSFAHMVSNSRYPVMPPKLDLDSGTHYRWYYWADKLGMLVWQDMPSMTCAAQPSPQGLPLPVPVGIAVLPAECAASPVASCSDTTSIPVPLLALSLPCLILLGHALP